MGNLNKYAFVDARGAITSAIPDALKSAYYNDLLKVDLSKREDIAGIIFYRPEAPSINVSGLTTFNTTLAQVSGDHGSATLLISYDATNNQTTYDILNPVSRMTSVFPIDLRCVQDLDSRGAGAVGPLLDATLQPDGQTYIYTPHYYPFSGTVNGLSYRGQVGAPNWDSSVVAKGLSASPADPPGRSYQFFDVDGSLLAMVETDVSNGRLRLHLPGNGLITAPPGHPPSIKTGSGTFSQTKAGQTLSGTFLPRFMYCGPVGPATATDSDPCFWNN